MAFITVQAATFLQYPTAPAVMKGESVTDTSIRLETVQPAPLSMGEILATVVLCPLAIALFCYLVARKRM